MIRRLFLLTLLIFICPAVIHAQCSGVTNCTAAGLSVAQIQAALNSIDQDNTTLHLPAGAVTWTGTTIVQYTATLSVTVMGAGAVSATTDGASTTGTDQTTITDNINHSSGPGQSFQISTTAGKSFRLTGIFFKMDSGSTVAANGICLIGGTSTALRVDHMHFFLTSFGAQGIRFGGSAIGVADHNYFDAQSPNLTFSYAVHTGENWLGSTTGFGDKSWADSDHFGTSQFMFIEDNRFHNGDFGDGNVGGRYVLRHSTFVNDVVGQGQVFGHGTTDGRDRSMRAAEAYLNNFIQPSVTGAGNPAYSINGGTLLFWGNTVSNYRGAVQIDYTRKNNNTYNYQPTPNGWGNCGTPPAAPNGPSNWDQNTNSLGYACMDAPARGGGDLLNGLQFPNVLNTTTGTIAWPHQARSPVYIWNITYTPSSGYSGTCSGQSCLVANSWLTDNLDLYQQFSAFANAGSFNGTIGVGQGSVTPTTAGAYSGAPNCTAGPGGNTPGVGWWDTTNSTLYVCTATNTWTAYYTPFTYPHPLASGGVVPPPPPNAPTGLTGTVSASTVSLSWTASSGSPVPTAYTLYRGTVHGGPYSVVKSGLTSTSTTDTPPNGTWFYTVAAYVGGIVSNISGSGSVATVTCTTSCAFPTGATLTVGGNSTAGFNVTTSSTSQPTSSTFTFASSTSGTGTGGGAWQTASESAKSNEITATVPAALTATFLPASRTFASQTVGTSSASQSFTFTNTSGPGGTITISGKALSGANPGDYGFTDNCPSLLLSGLNCTANVTFTPTAAGTRNATLVFTDNATGSPQSVAMTGTGVAQAPGVSLNPTSLNFGDQTLSTTSTTRSIILTNTGSGALTVTSVVASGDFAVVTVPATNCGGTLASLATCSLNVTFTPTATGGRTGAITVTDNASGSPHVATLSGVGINTKCQMTGNVTLSGVGSVCQ